MTNMLLTRIYAQSNGRLSELENVISMAWNSDGSTLALSAIFSGQPGIWFYDAVSGEITSGIQSSPLYLNLSWSPDDTMIVGASGNEFGYTYSVFRVVDAQLVSQFDAGSRPLAVNWSADSSLVMLGDTESVILYDAFDGSIERVLSVPSNLPGGGGISSTAWDTENDRAYAVYAVRDILIWNSTTTELINAVEFPNSVIFPIALNGSGDELAVQGPNGQVLLVDPTTLSINHTLQAPNDETIRDIVWHEDNVHLVTFGGDEIIRIWNSVTASVVEEIAIGALITGPPVWRPGTNELTYSISNGTPTIQTVEALPIYPTADAGPDQTVTDADNNGSESVTLDGSASSDSDGTITSYVWTENSTQIATGATPTVDLAVGTHTITLTVTDDDGLTATDEVVITVNAPTSGRWQSIPDGF